MSLQELRTFLMDQILFDFYFFNIFLFSKNTIVTQSCALELYDRHVVKIVHFLTVSFVSFVLVSFALHSFSVRRGQLLLLYLSFCFLTSETPTASPHSSCWSDWLMAFLVLEPLLESHLKDFPVTSFKSVGLILHIFLQAAFWAWSQAFHVSLSQWCCHLDMLQLSWLLLSKACWLPWCWVAISIFFSADLEVPLGCGSPQHHGVIFPPDFGNPILHCIHICAILQTFFYYGFQNVCVPPLKCWTISGASAKTLL